MNKMNKMNKTHKEILPAFQNINLMRALIFEKPHQNPDYQNALVERTIEILNMLEKVNERLNTLEDCISEALDALNFVCGSDNREVYKCAATAIKQIIDKLKPDTL